MEKYPFVMLPVKIFEENLSAADFKVFGCLASYTNTDRICRVAVATMTNRLNIARRSVFESLKKLEKLGYIRRQPDITATGQRSNFYYIDFNPTPRAEICTGGVQKTALGSAENCTPLNNELDLNELDLKTKFLSARGRAKFSKKEEEGEKFEVTTQDKQIRDFLESKYDDVMLWAKLQKSQSGLAIKLFSAVAERNINPVRVEQAKNEVLSLYGQKIDVINYSNNIKGAQYV